MKIKPFKVESEDLEKYLTVGTKCPRCTSDEIFQFDSVEVDDDCIIRKLTCSMCHLEIREVYDLAGVELDLYGEDPTVKCNSLYLKDIKD